MVEHYNNFHHNRGISYNKEKKHKEAVQFALMAKRLNY